MSQPSFARFPASTILAALAAFPAAPATAQQVASQAAAGNRWSASALDKYVLLQPGNPGLQQNGHIHIDGVLRAAYLVGDGSYLTTLNAGNVLNGTLSDARLSANVALLDAAQSFSGVKSFLLAPTFSASGAPFAVDSSTKVSNLNADSLDGFDSSAFLKSLPNPLVVSNATFGGFAVAGQTTGTNGTGVYGQSLSSTAYGIGVAAVSNYGPGASAISYGGNYPGLEASSNAGNGVTAYGAVNGVEGHSNTSSASGVYGENNSGGYGVGGRGVVGVWGDDPSGTGYGVYGISSGGYGVVSIGATYVDGDLYVTGSKFGYVVDLIRNGDNVALEPGDLVEIVGHEAAIVGEIPVTIVRRASNSRSSAVLGPIDCAVAIEALPGMPAASGPDRAAADAPAGLCPRRAPGSIAPGTYGNVVTLGAFRGIHVDSTFGAIRAGDLLVASPTLGYAMTDPDPRVGTVIGKALADWSGGLGEIPVLVSGR